MRFLYVHPLPWYLRVRPQRDVIELPITGDLDINGWELRNALGLLGKGNATLIEWLDSPIVYRADAVFLEALRALAAAFYQPYMVRKAGKERTAGVLRSYLHAAYAMAIRAPYDSAANATMATFAVEINPDDAIPTIPVRAGHRTLSAAELRNYLAALTDELPDLALRLAVLAGGQRMSQLLRTRVSDYNEDTQTLRLWDTKGKRREPRLHQREARRIAGMGSTFGVD